MRKETKKYYFSVEGETEKWYLEWLENTINSISEIEYRVKLDSKIQKDPLSRAKGINIIEETEITHIFDKESESDEHEEQFKWTLDRMQEAQNIGKKIKYQLGYSNFTFELWIILHKIDCYAPLDNRAQYLTYIKKAYQEEFENLKHYKNENSFKKLLKGLNIYDVMKAVERAKIIIKKNKENGYILHEYNGYEFYRENPALSIWEIIERILYECGLLKKSE